MDVWRLSWRTKIMMWSPSSCSTLFQHQLFEAKLRPNLFNFCLQMKLKFKSLDRKTICIETEAWRVVSFRARGKWFLQCREHWQSLTNLSSYRFILIIDFESAGENSHQFLTQEVDHFQWHSIPNSTMICFKIQDEFSNLILSFYKFIFWFFQEFSIFNVILVFYNYWRLIQNQDRKF